jgi:outer membrane protein TolC
LNLWAVEEQRGVYDPLGTFNFDWNRQKSPTSSALQGGDSITNVFTLYQFGYGQRFSTGTSLEIGFLGSRGRTTSFFTNLIPAIDTSFDILFRQNLLKGFGRIPADYQIEISRTNLEISQQEFQRRAVEVILRVQDEYWNLRFAVEAIRVEDTALNAAQTLLEQNVARFDVGSASRLEVLQGEAEVALRQEERIRVGYRYRQIQDRLIRLISEYEDPRSFPFEIVPADVPDANLQVSESFEQLQVIAQELRPELQQAGLQIDNGRVSLDQSRNELRPTLDLVAGYQQFGLGGNRVVRDFSGGITNPEIIEIIPGGIADSLDQLFSAEFYGYLVALELQLPIFNREARSRNAQAQIHYDQAVLSQQNVQQLVSLEIRNALTELEMNQASLQTGRVGLRAAQERMEAEQARFEVGAGTTRQLIEAQRDLLRAESIVVRAETDLMKSHALLDRALGRTFERHNISLTEALEMNVH